ncbi:MAG: phosphate signaling complex protein PhoU [Adhaeribacter sp.]
MNQLEKELQRITSKVSEMWALVEYQVIHAKQALVHADTELAKKVIKRGKRVNAYDIKIDRMIENFFALYNPVAVDLRWALAILKINANLERIGDSAESVAVMLREIDSPLDPELVQATQLWEMYDGAISMLTGVHHAFDQKDTEKARELISQDRLLNNIHRRTDKVLIAYIKQHPDRVAQALKVSGIIRKLERIGDQVTNIAEEIVFYVDAKVVKHKKIKKRKGEQDNNDTDNDNVQEHKGPGQ